MTAIPSTASQALEGLLCRSRNLDDLDLLDDLHRDENARRRADAEYAVKLVVLAERAEAGHGGYVEAAMAEVGLLLGISTRAAEHRIDTAGQIVDRPLIWTAWHDGRIDRMAATKIATMLADVPDPRREQLEAQAIAYAQTHTTAQLHKKLVAMTCDEDPDERLRKQALDRRGVEVIHGGYGMATISGYVSQEIADSFIQALDQYSQQDSADPYGQGDDRTLDQRRADALAGFVLDHTIWDIDVHVLIPADMLMGVETKGANLNGSPCTHALATMLAWSPDARWTRLVTDPLTGVLLDVGRTKYEIPPKVRAAIRLRDVTCRFARCTRPAEYTDSDHVDPFRRSGRTDPSGLVCLCRHHHRAKNFGAWKVSTTSTYAAETTWVGTFGISYTTRPPDQHRRRE